jgi:pantoate--beta-alanine ligase
MKTIETIAELRSELAHVERPLGLVPTMGALHEGHMALVRQARHETKTLTASIFVNPAQFGPHEDLSTYPRDMDADLAKMEQAGVDLVFTPPVEEVYPGEFDTYVDVGRVAARLEGERRPGHFRSVATVVCKLLAIVRPDRVYFGQKDAQQCLVAKRLNADMDLGAEIVVVPTVREADGLALSSRNAYLSSPEREAATVLYRALMLASSMRDDGVTGTEAIRREMRSLIETEPLARIDYVSVADPDTLDELDDVGSRALASLAVRIGDTRLIDNTTLEGSR